MPFEKLLGPEISDRGTLNPDSRIVLVVHISRVEALTIGAVLGFSFVIGLGLMSVAA